MTTLAGYTFLTAAGDTVASFDAQLAAMDTHGRAANWAATLAAYEGVEPTSGISIASLLDGTSQQFPHAFATTTYWGSNASADEFVRAAIGGTGDAAGWDDVSRREMLTKGAGYQVVRQAIFGRLRSGIEKCSTLGGNESAVYDWEAAYALHAGSLEGSDGTGSGKSMYALADKRCPQFDTCTTGSHPARSNVLALNAWTVGVGAIRSGDCFGALSASQTIEAQLTVPLVQGSLREAYEVDPNGGAGTADGVVEVAEGWAFLAAILPEIALCNASAASFIRTNLALSLDGANGAWVSSGFRAVKAAFEAEYPCLGVTCADVGGMLDNGQPIAGFEPCTDAPAASHDDDSLSTSVVVAMVVGGLALLAGGVMLGVGISTCIKGSKPPRETTITMATSTSVSAGNGV